MCTERLRRISLVLLVAVALVGCGHDDPVQRADEPTTSTTTPYNGRLHVTYKPEGYQDGGEAMSNWKMDPAPGATTPTMTPEEVATRFEASDFGRSFKAEGLTPRVFFGLFTGNVLNPTAPDGKLAGSHPVAAVPAWLIFVDGIMAMSGGGGASGPGETRPTEVPVKVHAITAYPDDPSATLPIAGLSEDGGPSPLIY